MWKASMWQSESAMTPGGSAAGPMAVLAAGLGLWLLLALNSPALTLATLMVPAVVLVVWAAWRVQSDTAHLMCALIMIELLCSATVIPISEEQRFMVRYPLLILFCAPCMLGALRKPMLWRGGFLDYFLYLGWGAVSITYSLLPIYSFARVTAAALIFVLTVKCVVEIKDIKDMERVLRWFLTGLGVVWIGLLATLVAVPHDLAWMVEEGSGMSRFRGFFGSPNQVGEVTLATICVITVLWKSASRRQKKWFALEAGVAVVLGALADSRSPFIGLAIGGLVYLLWRYRLRALPVCLTVGVLAFVIASQVPAHYFTRGNVQTLTGRTDVWKFAIQKIEERPLLGWGFEVEGQILQSKYFPVWWGPWEEGPHSSLHNGYLSRAVGIGVPALLFWVFFFLRPWVWLFRSGDDPWDLKRMFPLVIVPVLVLNMVETTAGDCRYSVGLLATLVWGFAERQRILALDARREQARQAALCPLGAPVAPSAVET
jgi:O-antigen ligase